MARSSANNNAAALRLLTAAGLGIQAYAHIHLAPQYDNITGSAGISQGMLFRSIGAIAILMALLVLASNSRTVHLLAFLTAGVALTAVLLYSYGRPGAIGPLPNMHDPTWPTLKTWSAIGEAVAVVTAATTALRRRTRAPAPTPSATT